MYDHWKNNTKSISKQKFIGAKKFLKNIKHIYNKKNLNILDIGCGNGVHLSILNSLSQKNNLYGIDTSKSLVEFYNKKFRDNIKLTVGNCSKLPYPNNSMDIIIFYGVLPYIKNPKKTFNEINRVLKVNGEVLIWTQLPAEGINLFFLKCVQFLSKNILLGNMLANLIVPFLFFIKSDSKLNLFNSTWAECLEIVKINTMVKIYYHKKNYFDNLINKYKNFKKLKIKYNKNLTYYLKKNKNG